MASSNGQNQTKSSTSTTASRRPYIHWIHCNVCYEQYMNKTRKFFLLACDHVCCETCVENISEAMTNGPQIFKCPLCNLRTRSCKLGNEMPSHLKELFHPEPYLEGLNSYRIMIFQEKHEKRFLDYLDRQFTAIQEGKKEVIRIKEQAKQNYLELEDLITERKQLERRIIAIKQQRQKSEEKRQSSKSNSTTDTSSRSSVSKKQTDAAAAAAPASNVINNDVTSFAHHMNIHAFTL